MKSLFTILLALIISPAACGRMDIGRVTILPEDAARAGALAAIKLPSRLYGRKLHLHGHDRSGREVRLPLQSDGGPAWFIIPDSLPAGETVLTIQSGAATPLEHLHIIDSDSFITLYKGDRPVLRYVKALVNAPGRSDSLYLRNGFIHPLWAPDGTVLTRIHPADHLHHLGLWHPWTKVTFREGELDFWNLGKGQGTVRFLDLKKLNSGPLFAEFQARQSQLARAEEGNLQPVINEVVTVRLWNPPYPGTFLIDYTIRFSCATEDTVILDQYRYGGFGLRATDLWSGAARSYFSSEGNDIKTADGSRARWCLVSGPSDGGRSNILLMSHPANHAHPEPLRIWGDWTDDTFFNFCPVKREPWTLVPGQNYGLRYRIVIRSAAIPAAQAEQFWRDFAHPPKATVELL